MLSIGIIGLPNVGKSTLFKALTKKQINIANYPFCTIEPNKGIVTVPDERLEKLAKLSNSAKIVPTTIEFVDIAGLVSGAHKGEGLGNQFLSHIREVDAICQVVRDFQSEKITHVSKQINPKSDIEVINLELVFADLETVDKHLDKLKRKIKSASSNEEKEARKVAEILENKVKPALDEGKLLRKIDLEEKEKKAISYLNFLTIKSMIYVLNIDEKEIGKEKKLPGLEKEIVIPICAKLEADLTDLPEDEINEYLSEAGLEMTGLDKIISKSYKTLDLISFLTTGPEETRAWTVKKGAKAKEAAGVIHTDFEEKFIRAETVFWQDLVEVGSWEKAREKGLIRSEGKDYIIQDGDVIYFRI